MGKASQDSVPPSSGGANQGAAIATKVNITNNVIPINDNGFFTNRRTISKNDLPYVKRMRGSTST